MKKSVASSFSAALILGVLTGCSPYSTPDSSSLNSLADLACTTSTCVTPTTDNLSLKVNLNGGTQFAVQSGLADFNLAGDCNEGGFAYNTIMFELFQADTGAQVRTSTGMGANSACVNGRFSIYVNLASATSDPVNRAGLLAADGARHPYTVRMAIFGQNTYGGPLQTGSNNSYQVQLLPQ